MLDSAKIKWYNIVVSERKLTKNCIYVFNHIFTKQGKEADLDDDDT